MTRKERLDKIQEVLEENLNLDWTDRMVFNIVTESYHTADIFDFCGNQATHVYLRDSKGKAYRARVMIKDESFIIKMNGMTIDATEHWKELLDASTVDVKQ
jgi:hypothetical protein